MGVTQYCLHNYLKKYIDWIVGKQKFCKTDFIMLSTYGRYLFTKIKSTELFNNMIRLK